MNSNDPLDSVLQAWKPEVNVREDFRKAVWSRISTLKRLMGRHGTCEVEVDGLPRLPRLYNLHGGVITTTRLDPRRADRLNHLAGELGLALYRWRPQLQLAPIAGHEIVEESPAEPTARGA